MNPIDPAIAALCRSLIAIPSVTGEGTRRIADFCAREIFAPNKIEARLVASLKEGPEQVNLMAFVTGRNLEARPLLLNTHLDTVPPGDGALWTECAGNPFQASINGDRIYGLGAADTKLDFLAKAIALSRCGQPNRSVWLVGTFGEERGLVGAKELAASNTIPPDAIAMIGEPSQLTVITAHKGLMAFELTIQFEPIRTEREFDANRIVFIGRAAHSSTPALGENAIAKALAATELLSNTPVVSIDGGDAVNKVPARCEIVVASDRGKKNPGSATETLRFSHAIPSGATQCLVRFANGLSEFSKITGPVEADYAAPTLTSNLGVVHTRDDAIVLNFELRPPPSLGLEGVREGVRGIVETLASGNRGLTMNLSEKRGNRGFRSSDGSEAVELAMGALTRASLPLNTGVKTGCTEAGVYAAVGFDPIVFGPGPSTGVIHAPNEYNFLSEVEAAIRFYRALLE